MKHLFKHLTIPVLALSLAACGGSSMMKPTSLQQITPPGKGKAKIVFMRSSFVAGAISADMLEIMALQKNLWAIIMDIHL